MNGRDVLVGASALLGVSLLAAGNVHAWLTHAAAREMSRDRPAPPEPNPHEWLLDSLSDNGPAIPTVPAGMDNRWVGEQLAGLLREQLLALQLKGEVTLSGAAGDKPGGVTETQPSSPGSAGPQEAQGGAKVADGVGRLRLPSFMAPETVTLKLEVASGAFHRIGDLLGALDRWPVLLTRLETQRGTKKDETASRTPTLAPRVVLEFEFCFLRKEAK